MRISVHRTYLYELGYATSRALIGNSTESFCERYAKGIQDLKSRYTGDRKRTAFAEFVAESPTLGKDRVGFVTLLAQDTILASPKENLAGSILVAIDLVHIADSVATSSGDKLQVAITNWAVGKDARDAGLLEEARDCYQKAVQTYVNAEEWAEVADLCHNLGLVEAMLGYKEGALAWLHRSAQVDADAGRTNEAAKTTALANDMSANFNKYQ